MRIQENDGYSSQKKGEFPIGTYLLVSFQVVCEIPEAYPLTCRRLWTTHKELLLFLASDLFVPEIPFSASLALDDMLLCPRQNYSLLSAHMAHLPCCTAKHNRLYDQSLQSMSDPGATLGFLSWLSHLLVL